MGEGPSTGLLSTGAQSGGVLYPVQGGVVSRSFLRWLAVFTGCYAGARSTLLSFLQWLAVFTGFCAGAHSAHCSALALVLRPRTKY